MNPYIPELNRMIDPKRYVSDYHRRWMDAGVKNTHPAYIMGTDPCNIDSLTVKEVPNKKLLLL